MPQKRVTVVDRRDNGDIDWYACGERARQAGRPIWANPGVGNEADRWRAGYREAEQPIARTCHAVPEFA